MMAEIGTFDNQMERGEVVAQTDKAEERRDVLTARIRPFVSAASDPSEIALGTHPGMKTVFYFIVLNTDRDSRY